MHIWYCSERHLAVSMCVCVHVYMSVCVFHGYAYRVLVFKIPCREYVYVCLFFMNMYIGSFAVSSCVYVHFSWICMSSCVYVHFSWICMSSCVYVHFSWICIVCLRIYMRVCAAYMYIMLCMHRFMTISMYFYICGWVCVYLFVQLHNS
jgi:hypothetical protein